MKCWQKPKLKYRNELLSAEEKFIKARLSLSQEFNSWLNDKKTNLTASLAKWDKKIKAWESAAAFDFKK
jgi:hypothetical protein